VLPQICQSGDIKLYNIDDINIYTSGSNIYLNIKGEDENGKTINCIAQLYFENNVPLIDLVKISYAKANTTQTNKLTIKLNKEGIQTNFKH
jgi:HSP20 family molecular chaperone IbpA